ncbi:MAG TPA: hypothetical protein VH371_10635 [Candidatus Limnocylindrales bacterium]
MHAPAVGADVQDRRRSIALAAALAAACVAILVGSASPALAAPNSLHLKATYRASAFIHWADSTLTVSSSAAVTNTTNAGASALTFNLVPLETGDATVSSVTAGGAPARFSASGQSLIVTLPARLKPGTKTNVTIKYKAHFNAARSGSHRSLFIQQNGIVAAYRWIPWLSRAQRFNAPNFGETWVTAVSPRVTVTLNSDTPLRYATNGTRTVNDGNRQIFVARDVRDFNFAAGTDYEVTSTTHGGVAVTIFSATQPVSTIKKWTLAALDRFDSRIGNYPYPRLTVAETPGGSGMESPGMTWISSTEPKSNLAYLAVHEVAHQWFYGAVGNNQALQPFLDEGVADFLARDMLDQFRKSRCDKDRLDGSVYHYSAKCYNEVIYVQSSLYLNKYRQQVGDGKFWAGMSDFYRDYKFDLSGTRAFWDTLDNATGYASHKHADRFPSLYP